MKPKKPLVIFVDDSKDELDLFRQVFEHEYNLVLAQSAQEAIQKLGGYNPDLILLDVYIPEEGQDRPVPPELAKVTLELPPDRGELRQAYNNLVLAQQRFKALQEARAHGLTGGLKLARVFAEKYRNVPLIGYSRKSSPLECLVYLATIPTAVDFVQKPNDPLGWGETRDLTQNESKRLHALFDSYIRVDPRQFGYRGRAAGELLECIGLLRLRA